MHFIKYRIPIGILTSVVNVLRTLYNIISYGK